MKKKKEKKKKKKEEEKEKKKNKKNKKKKKCSPLFYLNLLAGIKTGNKIFILTRFFLISNISTLNYSSTLS